MKIVVCAKQVPDTNEVRIDPEKNTLIREGVPSILNPDDANALEQALQIKDADPENVRVTVVSMGPPQAVQMLQECLAMGADEAVLLSDRALGGSDTWATSNALAAAIRKLGADIIFAGRQAIDGDTAQVGPQIAEKLGIPQVTYVRHLALKDKKATVKRALEDGYELVEACLPCLLTAIKELNRPRYMSVPGIMRAAKADIPTWTAADIGVELDTVGLKASPTNVFRSFSPKAKGAGVAVPGDTPGEQAANLLGMLGEKHLI